MSNVENVLDALGDPTRRLIIERLRRGPLPVHELAAGMPVGRPAVSKHLRVLGDAGLVEHASVGTSNRYALATRGYVVLQRWLLATWDRTLLSCSTVDGCYTSGGTPRSKAAPRSASSARSGGPTAG